MWMSHCCCWDLFNLIKISFSTFFITFYVFCLSIHHHFSFPGDMEFFLSIYVKQFCNFATIKNQYECGNASILCFFMFIPDIYIYAMKYLQCTDFPFFSLFSIIYLMFVFFIHFNSFFSCFRFRDAMIKLGANRVSFLEHLDENKTNSKILQSLLENLICCSIKQLY